MKKKLLKKNNKPLNPPVKSTFHQNEKLQVIVGKIKSEQEELKEVSDEVLKKTIGIVESSMTEVSYKEQKSFFYGPIPSAIELKKYKTVLPTAPERILTMAEREQGHRIESEKKLIKGDIKRTFQGQWFGFIVAILAFMVSVIFVLIGSFDGAVLFSGWWILQLVALFLRPKRDN